jgi:tripartite-type tricarboxylate transporter receptor subunit TctC
MQRKSVRRTWEAANMMRFIFTALLCAGWALHSADPANAQAYPTKEPIKVIVPFPPGGPTDGMARIISERLGAVLGQTIVIENRGGAGGGIGGKFVAEATPDGYTILMTPGGALTTGPIINPNIGYDPVKVFASVCELIETPLIVSVNPSLPVKSMAEIVAYAKANPGKIKWGSQGFGTAPHLLAEMFQLEANVNILHVPYRGTAPAMNDLIGGHIQMFFDLLPASLPQIESRKVRALANAGATRPPALSGLPTIAEQGIAGFGATSWVGLVAPARIPAAVTAKLIAEVRKVTTAPDVAARIADLGSQPGTVFGADFAAFMAQETAKWAAVIKASGARAD